MTALQLLTVARQSGIVLEANGDRLCVDAPAGTLTPGLREALVAHKPALLVAVSHRFVSFRGGLVVPVEAFFLALELEDRGIALAVDADHQLVMPADAALTETDWIAIVHW